MRGGRPSVSRRIRLPGQRGGRNDRDRGMTCCGPVPRDGAACVPCKNPDANLGAAFPAVHRAPRRAADAANLIAAHLRLRTYRADRRTRPALLVSAEADSVKL